MKEKYILNGHKATVTIPDKGANGNWVWRAEFPDDFNYADKALLEKGWHLAYYKVSDMYGCPDAIELMKGFHDDVIKRYNLKPKADIFGFSRGGLYAVNYTIKYPGDISSLYLDAPVLDIFSWPGGRGKGMYIENLWKECTMCYGATPQTADSITQIPINHINELIDTKVPVLLIAGGADTAVPYEENGELLYKAYKENNAPIKVIVKPDCGHHPHSLSDPTEIVDFIINAHK